MAIESRSDLAEAIRSRGRQAVERELMQGDFGVSIADISQGLYRDWGKEETQALLRGSPTAMQYGVSAQSALGKMNRLKAGISPQFQLEADAASKLGEKRALIERQKRANQFGLELPGKYRSALSEMVGAKAAFQDEGRAEAELAGSLVGGGLGVVGSTILAAAPSAGPAAGIPAAIGAALAGAGAVTAGTAQGVGASEKARIAGEARKGRRSAQSFSPTYGVPISQLPQGASLGPQLAGAYGGQRFRLTDGGGTSYEDLLASFNPAQFNY